MIDVEVLRDRSIMIIRPGGRLDKSDFEHIEREFDQLPRLEGKINGLLIDARAFPGWSNRAAFARHIRFIKDHHSRVRRIAAVSDAIILRIFAAIAKYLVSAELRYFSLYEKDRALDWLQRGHDD